MCQLGGRSVVSVIKIVLPFGSDTFDSWVASAGTALFGSDTFIVVGGDIVGGVFPLFRICVRTSACFL